MSAEILVRIPLTQLNELVKCADEFPRLKAELIQLRRQVDGLRGLYSECLDVLGTIQDKLYLEGDKDKR